MLTCLALFLCACHLCFSYASGKDKKNGKAYNAYLYSLLISVLKVTLNMWQAPSFAYLLFAEGSFPVGDFLCILNIFGTCQRCCIIVTERR